MSNTLNGNDSIGETFKEILENEDIENEDVVSKDIKKEELENFEIEELEIEKDANNEEDVVVPSKFDVVNSISLLKSYALNRHNPVYSQVSLKRLNQLEKKIYEEP